MGMYLLSSLAVGNPPITVRRESRPADDPRILVHLVGHLLGHVSQA